MNARNGCYSSVHTQGEVKGKMEINRLKKERERKCMKGGIKQIAQICKMADVVIEKAKQDEQNR